MLISWFFNCDFVKLFVPERKIWLLWLILPIRVVYYSWNQNIIFEIFFFYFWATVAKILINTKRFLQKKFLVTLNLLSRFKFPENVGEFSNFGLVTLTDWKDWYYSVFLFPESSRWKNRFRVSFPKLFSEIFFYRCWMSLQPQPQN